MASVQAPGPVALGILHPGGGIVSPVMGMLSSASLGDCRAISKSNVRGKDCAGIGTCQIRPGSRLRKCQVTSRQICKGCMCRKICPVSSELPPSPIGYDGRQCLAKLKEADRFQQWRSASGRHGRELHVLGRKQTQTRDMAVACLPPPLELVDPPPAPILVEREKLQVIPSSVTSTPVGGPRALEAEILRLRRLVSHLEAAGSLAGKIAVIDREPRVRAVFHRKSSQDSYGKEGNGGRGSERGATGVFVKPAVALAQQILGDKELYLLKCMVAVGQEQLLDIPSGWGNEGLKPEVDEAADHGMESKGASPVKTEALLSPGPYPEWSDCGSCEEVIEKVTSGSAVRDALAKLAQLIDEWDGSSSEGGSVFKPEGSSKLKKVLPSASDLSLLASGWEIGWETPGGPQVLREWAGNHLGDVPLLAQLVDGWEATPWGAPWEVPGGSQFLKEWEVGEGEGDVSKKDGRKHEDKRRRDCEYEESVPVGYPLRDALHQLANMLERMEKFYSSVGGVVGYQLASLELILATEVEESKIQDRFDGYGNLSQGLLAGMDSGFGGERSTFLARNFLMPVGKDLSQDTEFATQATAWGLEGLPLMGEIYPLGGAGDRLGLVDEVTGECLPVAMLPYCGRTLLEGLIRDLQAREYLHYRVMGTHTVTPIAIMTSQAKKNNMRVRALCEANNWFGRGRDRFRLFEQPLVPAVSGANGHWLSNEPLGVVQKPGGHGVIWKLAYDEGIFDWFQSHGRRAATVRQISNPLAGADMTLLALTGAGLHGNKKFGFASCDRNVGTAEGVNVLQETLSADGKWTYGLTCVEYTEFEKLGIADVPVSPDSSRSKFPANTNVLFVDLESAKKVAASSGKAALPGMIMNLKKPVKYIDHHGRKHSVRAGRLECTMQNIADELTTSFPRRLSSGDFDELDTFLLYNDRRKVTSSAKRQRKPNDISLHQTPDGSFLDLMRNAKDLLGSCGVDMPDMLSHHMYLDSGPPFLVLFHPALGPLWDVIRQKIRGGSLAPRAEVQLEIAELAWRDVHVDGSLVIKAGNVMGSMQPSEDGENLLQYGNRCGRCRLKRVRVVNAGIDWAKPSNLYWQHRVERHESLRIILQGNAEFEATDVTIMGAHSFEVPDGHRMHVAASDDPRLPGFCCRMEPLPRHGAGRGTWEWLYNMGEGGAIKLEMVEH